MGDDFILVMPHCPRYMCIVKEWSHMESRKCKLMLAPYNLLEMRYLDTVKITEGAQSSTS